MEPFGTWRDNFHHAQQTAMLYNINRGRSPARKITDFMYQDPYAAKKSETLDTLAALRSMAVPKDGD